MTKKTLIAGIILTLNEADDLPRSLASLSWCDDLIVVDSGSTDNTAHIAKHYGAKFFTHIQQPPFLISEQRNWALSHCNINSQWVLFLDADEQINPDLRDEILQLLSTSPSNDAYELTPRYLFMGRWLKHTQRYPNWHPRLVKRVPDAFTGGVWESFSEGLSIGQISTPYDHYAFSKGINSWIITHLRYADCDANSIYKYRFQHLPNSFETNRFLLSRKLTSYLWPIKPILRFIQKYFLNLGFLDGWQGLLFSLMMAFYDLIVVIKVIERYRRQKGLHI